MKRILCSICAIILAYIVPWYIALVVAMVVLAFRPRWIELILVGVIIDGLYGMGLWHGIMYPITLLLIVWALFMLLLGHMIRK